MLVCLDMANTIPFVSVATLCDAVLEGKDNVLSIIRIVDTYTVNKTPPPAPVQLPPGALPAVVVKGLISLRAGDLVGEHRISLVLENPKGERKTLSPAGGWPVVFRGGEHGVNIRLEFPLGVKNYGLCWFDVFFGEQESVLLTRIPLRLQDPEELKSVEDSRSLQS